MIPLPSKSVLVGLSIAVCVVALGVAACGVESVYAKDYNQSCSTDTDCVTVEELEGDGNSCKISCKPGVINKKDQEKYKTELDEEKGSCTEIAQPFCDVGGTAVCRAGKCGLSTDVADAGASDQ